MTGGYYYQLLLQGGIREILRTNSQGRMETISRTGSVSTITLTPINRGQVSPIRLTDQLLTMVGFTFNTGNIYSLTEVEYFEGLITDNTGTQIAIYLRKDSVGYTLVVPVAGAPQNCKLMKCFRIHELQELLRNEYNARIVLSRPQLVSLCIYLNNLWQWSKIIETLPGVASSFKSSYYAQHHVQPCRDLVVTHIANCYNITDQEATYFMNVLHI